MDVVLNYELIKMFCKIYCYFFCVVVVLDKIICCYYVYFVEKVIFFFFSVWYVSYSLFFYN